MDSETICKLASNLALGIGDLPSGLSPEVRNLILSKKDAIRRKWDEETKLLEEPICNEGEDLPSNYFHDGAAPGSVKGP